ncbi:MAG: hypothetical protein K8R68_05845, partial [Bacteroidales bacterium]|nr:hypothetical protein [Bacteroidales bacterium]
SGYAEFKFMHHSGYPASLYRFLNIIKGLQTMPVQLHYFIRRYRLCFKNIMPVQLPCINNKEIRTVYNAG